MKTSLKLQIPHFKGVFMRDRLPQKIGLNESAIINLDSESNPGTHWVCYKKRGAVIDYFDSYGDLRPPVELVNYFKSDNEQQTPTIRYNYDRRQGFDSVICGHLCLEFLSECSV